ncbi:MAG: RnfH family protein [Methylobacter sp.]|jgi:putative ubiquitin-RnfH superfamily antitoxin RatB of RatAB toxin-antitoxin module|uniref:RnfH family protein n=1 Tax=Methylobacter sp. TaxID=2051955 RepID=UPI0025EE6AE7|nr:RnfH family protein [Methylobacter sp.]MCK9621850.1 RnfH family protein [Methylobacter sp.]
MVNVEVAYAKPEEQVIVVLQMQEGTTVEAAIKASGLPERFPEIVLSELNVGIFGVACKLDQPVREGDRIEIYRPLVHDPKEARRQRALKGG